MNNAMPLSVDGLRGFTLIVQTCAEVFVNEPSSQVIENIRRVGRVLGDTRLIDIEVDNDLHQRYYDRFFVPTSPFYVPLCESSVRGAVESSGCIRYAAATGSQADHVLKCYRAVEFDYRAILGFEPTIKSLKPDSMASELLFMAALANNVTTLESDTLASVRSEQLLRQFVCEHAVLWFRKAADCLLRTDDDLYARVASLAADAVESIAE